MKALIQRVKNASVTIEGKLFSKIDKGLLVFLGVQKGDTQENADKLAQKLINLRIFEDENEKMNLSLKDVKGEMLIVSQFTLCGDCKKGTRPSFDKSAPPAIANELYEYFISKTKSFDIPVQTGKFGAMMDVELLNDGPVTFMVEK
jgi:D-tyrosyl-tRNA(Tyr) deacylase